MARIDIRREHNLPPARAKQLLEALAHELTSQFGATYSWAGKQMIFEKDGISGTVELQPGQVHIASDLGFLLSPLKPTIERQINAFMDDLLAKEAFKSVRDSPKPRATTTAKKTSKVAKKVATQKRGDVRGKSTR